LKYFQEALYTAFLFLPAAAAMSPSPEAAGASMTGALAKTMGGKGQGIVYACESKPNLYYGLWLGHRS